MNVPLTDGVPLTVITFDAYDAETPVGKPVLEAIPVTPVVAWVMFVIAVLIHTVGLDEAAPTVLSGVTVMVPVVLITPQPPLRVTV